MHYFGSLIIVDQGAEGKLYVKVTWNCCIAFICLPNGLLGALVLLAVVVFMLTLLLYTILVLYRDHLSVRNGAILAVA